MEVQAPTSSSHSQATDLKSVPTFDAMSFATRMSSFDQTCSCCPYGYHIDLDFLRYLDSLHSSDTLKKLKKIRCSKDGSLPRRVEPPQQAPQVNLTSAQVSLASTQVNLTSTTCISTVSENLVTRASSRRGGKEVIVELDITPSLERSTIQSSPESTTIAVSPNSDSKFRTETELFISNSSDVDASENRESSIRSVEERFDMSLSARAESYSKRPSDLSIPERPGHLTLTQLDSSISAMPYRPFSRGSSSSPIESDASSSISPAVLQAIREQMALSLHRMKQLEEQVKVIPALQARISMLVRENQHLIQAVRSSEVSSVGARVATQRLIDERTQTEESSRSSEDVGTQDATGRREVDVNFNRVMEEESVRVEMVEVSPALGLNRVNSQEAKYYSVAIQCQLLTDESKSDGGVKEEMTSVAVEVRPSVISRCVGTDDGFLWYPADSSTGDSGATYEQRLAWWLKLGVDKATSVDETLANNLEFESSKARTREVIVLEERQLTTSRAVPCVTVERVQLATPQTFTEVLGEDDTFKDDTVPQRNADFTQRLNEDSGEDTAEEEMSEFSDRSFEFEAAVAENETSFLQSDDSSKPSTVKAVGSESGDEDVLVEKAVGGYEEVPLEREMTPTEGGDVSVETKDFFGTAEEVWLEKESDSSGTRDSLASEEISDADKEAETKDEEIADAGKEAETKDEEIADAGKEAETKDEGISNAGKEAQIKDDGISNAGKEAQTRDEEISDAAKQAEIKNEEISNSGKIDGNKGRESIDIHVAVANKDETVLGEDQGMNSEKEFVLVRDNRAPMLESRRGTLSLETNLEVLLEQEVEKEQDQEISVEMSLENKEQKQDDQGNSLSDVDLMNFDAVSVVMNAQASVSVSEETVSFNRKSGNDDEDVSDAAKEAVHEDEAIANTGKEAEGKNEDISDAVKETEKDIEEISAAGEEAGNENTEIVDLHTAIKNKDDGVLGEDQEAEIKAGEAENEGEAFDSEKQVEETKSVDKRLLDEAKETEEVLRGGKFLNEDIPGTFTDSEKEGDEEIFDTDSDMTRTDEESGGSYEIADNRVVDEETMVTMETWQEITSTSMTKRLAVLDEGQEGAVTPERDSADEETPKLVDEAVVAIDTRGETMETEVTHNEQVTNSEEKESEVRISEEKESEVTVSMENESAVGTSEENESEVIVSEENESEVRVSEEKESEVRLSEEKQSEVRVSEGKEAETRVSEEKEAEVRVSEEKQSEARVSEEKESEVRVSKEKESEVRVSEAKEAETRVSEEKESEVIVSEDRESEVRVSEEKESETRVSEQKESEVRIPEEKESEVRVSEKKESETRVSEQKESEVRIPEEKESEVRIHEEKESEVTVSEDRESEVRVSEEKQSETRVCEQKESEVRIPEEKESEVTVSKEKESEVTVSEEKESEVRIPEANESEATVSKEKETEITVFKEKESEVRIPEEKESEVTVSKEKESEARVSEVRIPEEKESEVTVSEEKESEVRVSEVRIPEEKESKVTVSKEKESEITVSEEKESEVRIPEEKESEAKVSEEKETEITVSKEKESEVSVSEDKESEVRVSEEKDSEEKESEEWELVEKVSDVKELSTEESGMRESEGKKEEVRETKEKETEPRESDTKESEEWELVDKETDQKDLAEEEPELVKSCGSGSNLAIELPLTSDSPLLTLPPSIDHIEIISTSDSCHESIIVSETELCQLVKMEHESRNSSGDPVDELNREPASGLLDIGSELVKGLPECEEVTENVVLCENVDQARSEVIVDRLELVDRKTSTETVHSMESEKNIVLDTNVEPDESIVFDASVEAEKSIVSETSVEPDKNIVFDANVEPEKSTVPITIIVPVINIVPHIDMESDKSTVSCTSVKPDQHAMPSKSVKPVETEDTKQAETAETFSETSQAESSSESQSGDFHSTESASTSTSTKRVVITETRIERRRNDQQGSSQGSSAIDSGELQKTESPEGDTEEELPLEVETTSHSPIPSSESQSADDSQKMDEDFVVRPDVLAACAVYAEYLRDPTVAVDSDNVVSCVDFLRNHWFDLSGRKTSDASLLQFHLDEYQTFGTSLAQNLINMADDDGNTAMHYAVSYGNMEVIEVLLNTEYCNVDKQNKAGYTAIMLASLLLVDLDQHEPLVLRLFHSGDVNSTSATSGQTSLMLAASHGRSEMVALLLQSGAEINLQDEDGSTALMCASEHGHSEVIRTLLSHPDCDSTITDVDGSTALSIAMEEGHHDIGVFLYAHMKAIDDRLLEED